MKDYYMKDEERFGFVSSLAYWLAVKMPRIRKFYNFVVEDVNDSKRKDLLDVGTGPGYIPIMLAETGKFDAVYAVDPSKDMIRIAKIRGRKYSVKFAVGSSRSIPLKRKFDLIISTLSFHHWAERESSLRYLKRFLKKKGEIRVYEFEREKIRGAERRLFSPHAVSKEELVHAAKNSGLKVKGISRKNGFIRAAFSN